MAIKPLKFSIVTVVLNRKDYIRQAIENVLEQDYPDFEHIVIDGASTDGTLDVIKSYPHVRWISEPDTGSVVALNKGLKLIQGDVFGWLNSDESYLPGMFHRVAGYLTQHPEWDMVYGTNQFVDSQRRVLGVSRFREFSLHRQILGLNTIPAPSAMFMRTRTLDGVGRSVNEQWRDAYDHDLWIRVAKKYRIHGVDEIFSRFTLHSGGGVTSDPDRAIREVRKIRSHHGGDTRLIDRLLWIPYMEGRVVLHRHLKWNGMIKRALQA